MMQFLMRRWLPGGTRGPDVVTVVFLVVCCLGGVLLNGCASAPNLNPPRTRPLPESKEIRKGPTFSAGRPIPARAWQAEVENWLGTPYVAGGLLRSGVDDLGFVFQVYRDVAGVTLPRGFKPLYALGYPPDFKELKPGDLIFFQLLGTAIDHVGIFLGGQRVAHAIKTKGVIISDLSTPEYATHVYAARRLLR